MTSAVGAVKEHMDLTEVVRQRRMTLEEVAPLKVDRMELLVANQAPGHIDLVEAQLMEVHCMVMAHEQLVAE